MTAAPRILFLDDDHVLRTLRLILCNAESDPRVRDFFAPEQPDLAPLVRASIGLRQSEGAAIGLAVAPGAAFEDATVIVFRRGEVTKSLLQRHPRLRLVQRLGERSGDIDLTTAAAREVGVSCLPRASLHFTAEHAILLMLALGKRLLQADRAVREGHVAPGAGIAADGSAYNWPGMVGVSGVNGKTLGIVGLGEVGTLVARIARGFGMRVLYHQRHRATPMQEADLGVEHAPLPDLLAASDCVMLHAANLPENQGMAGRDFFAAMKKGAWFVNTARGRLVDEDALFDALVDGRIAGAGLDVHGTEPRAARDRFAALPNVILTPHIAGGAKTVLLDEFAVIVANIHAALAGAPIRHSAGL